MMLFFLFFYFIFFNFLFIYLFLAVLGLRFCGRAFSSCSKVSLFLEAQLAGAVCNQPSLKACFFGKAFNLLLSST